MAMVPSHYSAFYLCFS